MSARIFLFGSLVAAMASSHAATFTVTRFDDPLPDGCAPTDCSLREAVSAANAQAGTDLIQLAGGTYTLTLIGAGEEANATGDLDVLGPVEIRGMGAASSVITIDGRADRLIDATAALKLDRLTLRDGRALLDPTGALAPGGGVRISNATLTLIDTVLSGHQAGVGGAVSLSDGDIAFERVTVRDNVALKVGGLDLALRTAGQPTMNTVTIRDNIANDPQGDGPGGLQLLLPTNTSATFTAVSLIGNQATLNGGGADLQIGGALDWQSGEISGNSAAGSAGGIDLSVGRDGIFTSSQLRFVDNLANRGNLPPAAPDQYQGGALRTQISCADGCGAITLSQARFTGNRVLRGQGGAVHAQGPAPLIEQSQFFANRADFGGAAYGEFEGIEGDALNFIESLIAGNVAEIAGGGVAIGPQTGGNFTPLRFTQSTVAGNRAPRGAGLALEGPVRLRDSTLYGNEASVEGGAIDAVGTTIEATNSTLSANRASLAADTIDATDSDIDFTHVTLVSARGRESISASALRLADSSAPNRYTVRLTTVQGSCEISGTPLSETVLGNREGPGGTCGLIGTSLSFLTLESLSLGPRQHNGGLTRTHLPGPNSSVRIAASLPLCPELIDQRTVNRFPVPDRTCDAGAVEQTPSDVIFVDDYQW
jgi:CSLREA domain-containing protein